LVQYNVIVKDVSSKISLAIFGSNLLESVKVPKYLITIRL
jgi:hypothetical protein